MARGRARYGQLQLDESAMLWEKSLELAVIVYRANQDVQKFAQEQRQGERARCLRICAQYPDNLMAQQIAKLIRKGEM